MYEKNLWQLIVSDDVITAMQLLGCDERYISGSASDFECFREWISAYPFLNGNETAEKTAEMIGGFLGTSLTCSAVKELNASLIWKRHCGCCVDDVALLSDEFLYNREAPSRILSCDEKEKILSRFEDVSLILSQALSNGYDAVEKIEKVIGNTGSNAFGMKVSDGGFERPDRYHTERYYAEYISGEKSKSNYILSQILLDAIYEKRCEIIHLIAENKDALMWIEEFVKYLVFRKLKVKIAVHFHREVTPDEVEAICLIGGNVIPVMSDVAEENIEKIARIIPSGIMVS